MSAVVIFLSKSGIGKSEWKKYLNRNNSRHDFQIDIAISLIKFPIALEWYGESKLPGCMRRSEFVPCDCGMCYFCLNVLTGGIGHKENKRRVAEYSCGTCINTTRCTNEHASILGKSLSYCRMCYRNQRENLKSNEKKEK